MQELFLELVKLSLTGSLFVLAVMVVRLVFRKAPKWIFCILWGVVALRLIVPISIESSFSLVPDRLASGQIITSVGNDYIGDVDIIYENNAGYSNAVEAGRQPIYSNDGYYVVTEKDSLEAPKTVGETVYPVLGWVWLAGMILMLAYTAVSYLVLRKKMEEATHLRDNIWQCERVDSPFVLGIVRPRIYLPYAITESDMANVIAHERSHIQRKDHWWKPVGFLLLSVHWFNPILWVAYIFLCRDIEAACDEKVIKHMGKDEMRAYSAALLHCSIHRHRIAACPLAFGEVGVKERIKRVMNYEKPGFRIIILLIVVSVAAGVLLLTNPADNRVMIRKIVEQEGYAVFDQATEVITLSVPASALPESIYSEKGAEFSVGEIVAYQDDTAAVYLKGARYSNEGTDNLYFYFGFLYDLPERGGRTICPYENLGNGFSYSASVRDGVLHCENGSIPDAVHFRGQDGDGTIWFYVSADALKQAEGRIAFDIMISSFSYLRDGESYGEAFDRTEDNERLLELVSEIVNNPYCAASSNPFDYIKASQRQYNEILSYGAGAVELFVEQLRTGENGLYGYVMAAACAEITGIGDKNAGADWATSQQWLDLYDQARQVTVIPKVIAEDRISGQQAKLQSFGYSQSKKGEAVIACGIAPWQGEYREDEILILDGENGQNQILLTPQNFTLSHYKVYLPDGTVYDDGTRTLYDSQSLRIMCTDEGVSLIAPFHTGEFIYEVELTWPETNMTVTYGLKVVMTGKKSTYDTALDRIFDRFGDGNPLLAVSYVGRFRLANAAYSQGYYIFALENLPEGTQYIGISCDGEVMYEMSPDEPRQILGLIESDTAPRND